MTQWGFLAGVICALAAFSTGRAEVRVLSPTNGTVYPAYSTVRIEVEPTFQPGENSVKYGVERDYYYREGNLIAEISTTPYSLTLSNVPAGRHKYVVWTGGELTNATTSVEIVVTNPPVHIGPYTMIEVIGDSSAMGINNDGVIVVNSGDYAYTWTKGIIRWIPMPEGYRGVALEINNAGDITGWYYPRGGKQTAFLRSGGVSRAIHIPGADSSLGRKLSQRGDVTGAYTSADGTVFGFIYTAEGVLFTNEPVSGSMNSYGMFGGTARKTSGDSIWKGVLRGTGPDGIEHRLPDMWRSGVERVNDAAEALMWGRKLGNWDYADDDALLYSHFKVRELSGFYGENRPRAMNKWGQAVGDYRKVFYGPRGGTDGYGPMRAFLWSHGYYSPLDSLVEDRGQWRLETANAINDHGQIVGTAVAGTPETGMIATGYLLNPRTKVLHTDITAEQITLTLHDRPGTTLKVQSSTNLGSWTTLTTNTANAAIREVSIPNEGGDMRFVRVMNDEVIEEQVIGN